MALEVTMPRMGQSMEEGRIVRWLRAPGARVERGEPLVEIETDKANIELEAAVSGRLAAILIPEDTIVVVGTVIALIEEEQAARATAAPIAAPATPEASLPTAGAPAVPNTGGPSTPGAPPKASKLPRVPASPLARRLAAEHGVDLRSIAGTGPGGRVGKADVLAWVAAESPRRDTGATVAPVVSQIATAPVPAPGAQRVSLNKMRRAIGQRMVTSKTTIPHFYLSIDLDMRQALALRDSLAARRQPVSLTAILLKAVALSLAQHPHLNATLAGDEVLYSDQIDLAVAVALDDGLITPIVPGCQALSLAALAEALQAVVARARTRRLQPHDLDPGTFTVSNLGMFGVKQFEAIINPPQAAILALGAIRRVPVFDTRDNVVAAQLLTATLSADHRIVDGAEAARFLATLKELLADGFALL
jgi:pyruvate dehydrogenase E2 component (dihydrolipoamide acetyltransferase)